MDALELSGDTLCLDSIIDKGKADRQLRHSNMMVLHTHAPLIACVKFYALSRLAGSSRSKKVFVTATGVHVEREVGYAILTAEGHETIDEVVFAEKGDMILLGVRTLEGFAVMVDNIGH